MRKVSLINDEWIFTKDESTYEKINIPHTWNNIDGTDGGNDYYRGRCHYKKELGKLSAKSNIYLELNGVSQSCDVYLNNEFVGKHSGGYSKFRFNITKYIKDNNVLDIYVTNEISGNVYPQQADFTFYGGITRDVKLINVSDAHFDLDYFGGKGIKVTPILTESRWKVLVELYTTNASGMEVSVNILDMTKKALIVNDYASITFDIEKPILWNGVENPYLYEVKAYLPDDFVSAMFGLRTFRMDPNEGFILNGTKYLLRGVARHQDRADKGSAISYEDMVSDMKIIKDMGATSIRLAHYQHDEAFYDLCDKEGIVVWAEIPYISEHLTNGKENTISQMTELIIQNYNHPSIVCYGLSNEICISNDINNDRLDNHKELNDLCHKLDSTRPTAMAHIGAFNPDTNPLFNVPDVHGINIYYGWYEKQVSDAKEYFDSRHKNHPQACFSITEYGADANPKYCGLDFERGDYSENYQAYYHEQMIELIEQRPYLWATYVWNMFDFGADGRSEGGRPGQNQKGLVTFDRKHKKDAYYLYQAHWSKNKMLHICNKQYHDRTEKNTRVVVYSNLKNVSLYVDDKLVEIQNGMFKYVFNFEISGKHIIKVIGNDLEDSCEIELVEKPNPSYHLDNRAIINWLGFIDKEKEGYFTLNSRVCEILANEEAREYILGTLKDYGVTYEYLTSDNPRSPGSTLELIPIKFVLRMCKGLTPEAFNDFAEGLMRIKK